MNPLADLDIDLVPETTTVIQQPPAVSESVRPAATETAFRSTPEDEWGWGELRDYIFTQMERFHGPQVRDPIKEAGIVKGFISRWGAETAIAIARAAFEVYDGMWRNAPISINRFCRGSDPYFSEVIAARL